MALAHRNRWLIGAGAAVIAGLLVWLLCTWGATAYATRSLESALDRPVTIEHVTVNPLTATVSLQGLTLGAPDHRLLTVARGHASLHWSSLWRSGVSIRKVALKGVHLRVVTKASGDLNLSGLGSSDTGNDDSTRVVIDHIDVTGGQLDWVDQRASSQRTLSFQDMTLSLADFDSMQDAPMHGSASARLGQGRLAATGDFSPEPLTGDLKVKGDQLALTLLNPWLADMQHLKIERGVLQGQGRLAFGRATDNGLLWQGDLGVNDVSVIDHQGQHVFGIGKADLSGMDVQGSHHLRVARLDLDAPDFLVLLDDQGHFNLTSRTDNQDQSQTGSSSDKTSSAQSNSGQTPNLALGSLRINNGTFRFEDHQMSPVVQLDIRSLEGRMDAFDTRSSAPAKFRFKGLESDDTPVAIEGSFSAGGSLAGEMTLTSKRLPLERFAPYVQRFGGYRIRSGIADLDLHYQLDGGQVTAKNHIVLKQLALSEAPVDSDASMPLRRLVGLLQSGDGVINLDIPIEASVKGSSVDMTSVVTQIAGEVMENLVTSPIDTLDAMINGDDNDAADKTSGGYTEGPLSQVVTDPSDE
ncbi:Uncharacterized protein involved in outer membrane biogenesis [Kushneria avicenniae]|uniref:Uncharacterized protein involved in outer membrane biogenesis n=1 Tax=Kushneria avicenniae TaxID=402385 RepID=A0A1I1GMA2_9GAMM|nr:DUF748 domain-containing protein [Kushneria avicenniae]SFC12575.1 Uncharacterized protein involved in outer membrane biogenesis [Kushneria avicenniae]